MGEGGIWIKGDGGYMEHLFFHFLHCAACTEHLQQVVCSVTVTPSHTGVVCTVLCLSQHKNGLRNKQAMLSLQRMADERFFRDE